ncbi:MAG: UDP-N-acetylglucosamine pyrophosphorylase [Clostridiaceae bacterium]|jgi:NDP-sugar pyrophosphorylase family protein|nr:UDP-N-acetylglucosamine pyrophosphorylase [Clostridiaceae bacterium]
MSITNLETHHFFHLRGDEMIAPFFALHRYPWTMLPSIGEFIRHQGSLLSDDHYELRGSDVWVARSAKIWDYVTIDGPVIIGEGTEIRPGAFIRGNVYVGPNSVVGNSTELKNSIFVEHVEAPHYNYIGDSILASHAHMGAGSITSNLRADRENIVIHYEGHNIETGLRKMGAILAEHVEVGCNAVLNPGVMLCEHAMVYPVSCVRVSMPAYTIHKNQGQIVRRTERL